MKISAENFADCVARIAAKGKVSASQAEDVMNRVFQRGEELKAQGVEDHYNAAADELAKSEAEAAARNRADALRNSAIRTQRVADIQSSYEGKAGKEAGTAAFRKTLSDLVWTPYGKVADNVQSTWRGISADVSAQHSFELRKSGTEKAAISGEMDSDIAKEMWAANAKAPPATSNDAARTVAMANVKAVDYLRDRLNAAGIPIGDSLDYVASTRHDTDLMRRAAGSRRDDINDAFKSWWDYTKPLLSDKTWKNVTSKDGETPAEAQDRFGKSVYTSLLSGVHQGMGQEDGFIKQSFEGSRNLARSLSEGRALFWKDSDSWLSYNKKFGGAGSITNGVLDTINRSSRNLALVQKLGTNPTGNFNTILQRITEGLKGDPDAANEFRNRGNFLKAVMAHLDGSANVPANQMWANIQRSALSFETASKLGGTGWTHLLSLPATATSEAAQHGVSRLGMGANIIKGLFEGMGDTDRQEIKSQLGSYSRGLSRDMELRFNADEGGVPGKMSYLAGQLMKWNGLHYVLDNSQAAMRETYANQLAREGGKEFSQLDPHLSGIMDRYGLGEKEWNLLRAVKDLPENEGMNYLTPRDALRIDPGEAEKYLRANGELTDRSADATVDRKVKDLGYTLQDRLSAYYGDGADRGVVTPGARERAIMLRGTQAGTITGFAARSFSQFKMWPLAAWNQIIQRDIYNGLSKSDAAWSIGTMLALSTVGGYLRMAGNAVAGGNPVPNPMDPKTILASMSQGGGVGILGDFLFDQILRRTQSGFFGTVGGPIASDLEAAWKMKSEWLQGKAGWPDIARFGVDHVPFANLIYLRGALNYMVWYHLYNAVQPGWWERHNQAMIKATGHPMAGYVPGKGIPSTPFGIGQ